MKQSLRCMLRCLFKVYTIKKSLNSIWMALFPNVATSEIGHFKVEIEISKFSLFENVNKIVTLQWIWMKQSLRYRVRCLFEVYIIKISLNSIWITLIQKVAKVNLCIFKVGIEFLNSFLFDVLTGVFPSLVSKLVVSEGRGSWPLGLLFCSSSSTGRINSGLLLLDILTCLT